MTKMTMKEYLEKCKPSAPIHPAFMNCGELLDLLNERDDLRDQLEAVTTAKPNIITPDEYSPAQKPTTTIYKGNARIDVRYADDALIESWKDIDATDAEVAETLSNGDNQFNDPAGAALAELAQSERNNEEVDNARPA